MLCLADNHRLSNGHAPSVILKRNNIISTCGRVIILFDYEN